MNVSLKIKYFQLPSVFALPHTSSLTLYTVMLQDLPEGIKVRFLLHRLKRFKICFNRFVHLYTSVTLNPWNTLLRYGLQDVVLMVH